MATPSCSVPSGERSCTARANGPVAFECDGVDGRYHTGWSVLVLAQAEEITDPTETARLERLPLAPWCEGTKSVWLRLRPQSITGRRIPPHAGGNVEIEDVEPVASTTTIAEVE